MKLLKTLTLVACMLALWLVAARTYAQNFTNLSSFGGVFGNSPLYSILPGPGLILSGGTLYGTASFGGSEGYGMVFKVNTDGTGFTNLYNFDSVILYDPSTGLYDIAGDGVNPYAGLVLSGGTLYGTTQGGGTNSGILYGGGTVFAVSTNGTGFTTLYSFSALTDGPTPYAPTNRDGALPYAGLILSGGTLYGTASRGGTNGSGTVFAINTNGTGFANLHTFGAITYDPSSETYSGAEGAFPYGGLILSGGTLYGTTQEGGTNGNGTVFAVSTNGTGFTTLYSFSALADGTSTNSDGIFPYAGLMLSGGTLYGTASQGGFNGNGTVFAVSTNGTGFTTLYSFGPATYDDLTGLYFAKDGANPYANLILSGRMLYGTTSLGGTNGYGAMFGVRTNGTGFTTLYSFSATISDPFIGIYGTTTNSDGAEPCAGLILSGNTLYGATPFGGTNGNGTAFALTLPPITPIPLNIQLVGNAVVLSWTNPAFFLQAAPTVTGVYVDVTSATSPYTNVITGTQKFFRLSN